MRPRLTNWKFGRDKFRREFWTVETNFVSPVRLSLLRSRFLGERSVTSQKTAAKETRCVRTLNKTDGNSGNVFSGVLFSKFAYQRKRWSQILSCKNYEQICADQHPRFANSRERSFCCNLIDSIANNDCDMFGQSHVPTDKGKGIWFERKQPFVVRSVAWRA